MKHLKRMTLILIIIVFPYCSNAPALPSEAIIFMTKPIQPFENLWKAVCIVESNEDSLAYNKKEDAVGIAQIRQCRVDHFNQITGKNYKLSDCYDVKISKEIFMRFVKSDLEETAKKWNGSGPMTEVYWQKVKKVLSQVSY